MLSLIVLATEGGIPASSPWAQLAVPIGVLVFIGSTYMLVRANLGTRRGYLVTATSLFGFMVIYSLFWTFGAPGTPPTTGPQNLPGTPQDAYTPVWRAFAPDSLLAESETYDFVLDHPDGFTEVPEDFVEEAVEGTDELKNFFTSDEVSPSPIGLTWEPVETLYAVAPNGYPVIAVTFAPTYQIATGLEPDETPVLTPDGERVADDESNVAPAGVEVGDVVPDAETYTAFAFYDVGSPLFPSLVVVAISVLLFALHALLLAADERRERRELVGEDTDADQPVPVRV